MNSDHKDNPYFTMPPFSVTFLMLLSFCTSSAFSRLKNTWPNSWHKAKSNSPGYRILNGYIMTAVPVGPHRVSPKVLGRKLNRGSEHNLNNASRFSPVPALPRRKTSTSNFFLKYTLNRCFMESTRLSQSLIVTGSTSQYEPLQAGNQIQWNIENFLSIGFTLHRGFDRTPGCVLLAVLCQRSGFYIPLRFNLDRNDLAAAL